MGFDTLALKRAIKCCTSLNRDCKSCPYRESPVFGSCKNDLDFVVNQLCDFYDLIYVPNFVDIDRFPRKFSSLRRLNKVLKNIDSYYTGDIYPGQKK